METKSKKILLVEGKTDLHVVAHLWKSHGLPEKYFHIEACGSDKELLASLRAFLSAPEEGRPKQLGIILDADTRDASARWDAIKNCLAKGSYAPYANYMPSEDLSSAGTLIEGSGKYPNVGVWIMPDNLSAGMLEDFLAQLAPAEAMEFAKKCVADAKDRGVSSFKDVHQSKAEIHTYLAWQDEPGNPLGISIDAAALDVHLPVVKEFIEFLKKLFEIEDG